MSDGLNRRGFLAGTAGLGTLALAGPLAGRARAQASGDSVDLSEWFANTDDVAMVDWRGESEVTVRVGTAANGGGFGFGPALTRVDPGTTVTFEWTGQGGVHNVAAKGGAFESPFESEAGATFEWTAGSEGVTKYVCVPHESMGMKGAVVVGAVPVTLDSGGAAATPTPAAVPAAGTGDEAGGQSPPGGDLDGWMNGVENYDGVADHRGESEVTVRVGADGNGGEFAFSPAAVHVDPGTTVVWEWVGSKAYDVADSAGRFASPEATGAGQRYAVRFDGDGLSTYQCTEYGHLGMRGAVLVGGGPGNRVSPLTATVLNGVTVLGAGALAYGVYSHVSETNGGDDRRGPAV